MVLEKADKKQEEKEKKVIIRVVNQLPTQVVRQIEYEDRIENLVTIEEYLTAQANVRAK